MRRRNRLLEIVIRCKGSISSGSSTEEGIFLLFLVSHRFVLELFFLRVIDELMKKDKVNSLSLMKEYVPTCFNNKVRKTTNPSKSAIENALRNQESEGKFIKSTIGIKCDLPKKSATHFSIVNSLKRSIYQDYSVFFSHYICFRIPKNVFKILLHL